MQTLVLVPGLIIWLTDFCAKLTEKQIAKDKAAKGVENKSQQQEQPNVQPQVQVLATKAPSMAGFLGQGVR